MISSRAQHSDPNLEQFAEIKSRGGASLRWINVFFLVSIVLAAWSPIKALAYVLPPMLLLVAVLMLRDRFLLLASLTAIALFILGALLGYVNTGELAAPNVVAAFLTYSGALLLFASRRTLTSSINDRMPLLVHRIILIQGAIGIVQAAFGFLQAGGFDGSNGDRVEGTIHIALISDNSFSNVMFASNIAFCMIYLMPWYMKKMYLRSLFVGGLVFVLASVVHLIIMVALAVGIAFLVVGIRKLNYRVLVPSLVIAGLMLVASLLLPGNFAVIPKFVNQFQSDETPKARIVKRALDELPSDYDLFPIIGLGPGQMTSRAGLIMTGRFFGGLNNPQSLPGVEPTVTGPQQEYVMDLWYWTAANVYFGSTHQPFFSWMSVYTEFGAPALLLLFSIVVLTCRWAYRSDRSRDQLLAVSITAGLMLLFLEGFQENYWETPQAILLGVVLIRLMMLQLRDTKRLPTELSASL